MSSTLAAETETNATPESEKPALLLDSLEIKGYRCFEHLVVEKLGRVNLIVGKNSAGKTALLEALWIYAQRGDVGVLIELVGVREEIPLVYENRRVTWSPNSTSGLKNLFTGRPPLNLDSKELLSIGEFGNDKNRLVIYTTRHKTEDGEPPSDADLFLRIFGAQPTGLLLVCKLRTRNSESEEWAELFSFEEARKVMITQLPMPVPSNFVSSGGLINPALVSLWDEVQLTPNQANVLNSVRIINPDIEDIAFVGLPKGGINQIPIARAKNRSQPEPLSSFGEGMKRLAGIALALATCKDGLLMIDEIENGLHYSIQPDVWRMIFQTARELNVQVFATTHSDDCVRAFQKAAAEDEQDEGVLIRLVRQNERIKAITFDEDELATATKREIEVR